MKYLQALCLVFLVSSTVVVAQGPLGRTFGFGLILGEPYGATAKIWNSNSTAVALSLGGSYYGSLRIGGDYLWHFDAFNSSSVKLYAGPGVVVGVGPFHNGWWYKQDRWSREPGTAGIAVRGVIGLNFIPRNSPIELFMEAGPMINLSPGTFNAFDLALGFRFYP